MQISTNFNQISYTRNQVMTSVKKKNDLQLTQTNNFSSVWGELKKKYDVRNASIDDITNISTTLYNSGQISLRDHATLIFDPGKSPQQINGTNYLTQANGNKRDWIAEYQARADLALRLGDIQSSTQYKHIKEILERLSH